MYTISNYSKEQYEKWNEFVAKSKNGTFLFHRDFMEYHSDRFKDFSLLVFKGHTLIALLPAHIKDNAVYSHWGLTYGGLILSEKVKLQDAIGVFKKILQFLSECGIDKLYIKTIPHIYHRLPSEELEYALFLANAKLIRRDSLSVYDYQSNMPFSKDRRQCIRRGEENKLSIVEEPLFDLFWNEILIPNLNSKHKVSPVHTAVEIKALHDKFPDNIRHFNVYHDSKIVGGTTVFITDTVAHPQYISGNSDKNKLGSLDYLYAHLITKVFKDKKYFDFGISNEEQGRKLNSGISFWKESFGARTVVHDFYEVETANFGLLENVLLY
jgi:hypothetical protein